ncbi:DoxX family protein [Spirosoma pollinicola]|uniref:Oxidoreductase n=1 Tax=Spirosoma pollinicola TaxID=2057025 RepID=A0A2K8Z8G3_9BACT|nr:DoxX family protein [Spirosoma pollinicola]AUD06148.1 oxidoreductase [Spirosoma pollinicola]
MSASLRNTIAWILQVVLGLFFIFAGFNKLRDMSSTAAMFGNLGLPGVLAYVVGGAELLGGIGLLVPRLTRFIAMSLLIIMIGAVFMHATKIPGGLAGGIPALVCLILLGVLVWLRQPIIPTTT